MLPDMASNGRRGFPFMETVVMTLLPLIIGINIINIIKTNKQMVEILLYFRERF